MDSSTSYVCRIGPNNNPLLLKFGSGDLLNIMLEMMCLESKDFEIGFGHWMTFQNKYLKLKIFFDARLMYFVY